ncbi:hypothetical protein H0H87_002637, partial [Tephrocybe sp. NHM501043]
FWGNKLNMSDSFIACNIEPFLPTLFSHSADNSSAYPPSRERGLSPFNLYYAWEDQDLDDIFHRSIKQSTAQLKAVANAEGQDVSELALYPNYAIFDTSLKSLYGGNVPALRRLKALVDPKNVMGLAGGFKL